MATTSQRMNESFIKVLMELNEVMLHKGETFRAKAYRSAADAILSIEKDIFIPDELQGVKHLGKSVIETLNEFADTGIVQLLEDEKNNPVYTLTKVYGIGPKKAIEFVEQGITTIADLRKNKHLLTDAMCAGLRHFDDLEKRIPRKEIDIYNKYFTKVFHKIDDGNSKYEIVGSYRRGASDSGDIDIIISNSKNDPSIYQNFIDFLIKEKLLVEILSRGKSKCLAICKLPNGTARRVDFLYSSPDEFAFAILYFTGSKLFNTIQRQRALTFGYTLNEHGICHLVNGKRGKKVNQSFPSEKSIFDFLQMEYVEPCDRNRISKNIKDTKNTNKVDQKKITNLEQFKTSGISALEKMSEEELNSLIKQANQEYHENATPIMSDTLYDILREFMLEKFPKNKIAADGHAGCEVVKNKVKLPYEMGSMDKIKPEKNALQKWNQQYSGPFVLSCKLDGISGLYSTENGQQKLFTRGNGTVGQDISHLIPFLNLPNVTDVTVRGEFIVSKEKFEKHFAKDFNNSRNFVAGAINQKKIEPAKFKKIDFVVYEVIKPAGLTASQQMKTISKLGFQCVKCVATKKITNDLLSNLLIEWRKGEQYEIDGVICCDDKVYPRKTGNPDHAFAFKMVLSDQIAEAKVLDVIWTPSKDGYLKPRVQIEPVEIGGSTIEFATGFNARFIEDNKIGAGAVIKLIRSGDVIPHITEIVEPAEKAQFPQVHFKWNKTKIDIILEGKDKDETVQLKIITGFFKTLEVEGLSLGNVQRIMDAGFDTISKIVSMTKSDFLTVEGFKEKLATKIYSNIKAKMETITLPELMYATNIFGRGFGLKKIVAILSEYPDILVSEEDPDVKEDDIEDIDGMGRKSAVEFVKRIPTFVRWIDDMNLTGLIVYKPKKQNTKLPLYGKKFVMSGSRDKKLISLLENLGAESGSGVSKNIDFLIVKNKNDSTDKINAAKKLNIKIYEIDEAKAEFSHL